jgi:hypothetical protein
VNNPFEQAFYEARLQQDMLDERLSQMTIAERVEYERQTVRAQPLQSPFDGLPVVPTRAERSAAWRATQEAEAAAPPPDPAEMLRRLEAMEHRLAVLEAEAEDRRRQARPALYNLRR